MRVWRAERDLSMAAAAAMFQIDASHWSLLEAGKRNAGPQLASALAQAIGQPIQLFLGLAS